MKYPLRLISPIDNGISFQFSRFPLDYNLEKAQRLNQFSVVWVQDGKGLLQADFKTVPLAKGSLLFFEPEYTFSVQGSLSGIVMNFHSDFFYTIKHQSEVCCDDILFNQAKRSAFLTIPSNNVQAFQNLFQQIELAIQQEAPGQFDLLVAYLKILIIQATRIKLDDENTSFIAPTDNSYPTKILKKLKHAIDGHYKKLHHPSEYANLLNTSVKTLGRIAKTHYNKTVTALIAERILLEARRELYLTEKPIKEIAFDLGFCDEYHFSKYFKNKVSLSPLLYRNILRYGWDNKQKTPHSSHIVANRPGNRLENNAIYPT